MSVMNVKKPCLVRSQCLLPKANYFSERVNTYIRLHDVVLSKVLTLIYLLIEKLLVLNLMSRSRTRPSLALGSVSLQDNVRCVQVEMTGSSVFDYIHHQDHSEMAEQLGLGLSQGQGLASPSSAASEETAATTATQNPDGEYS